MIKLALRAEKARLLADKLGIIPHSESQWKWALRKLRPFVDKPKELAKAKERIGKLSNNAKQRLLATLRKRGLGQEVLLTSNGNVLSGDKGTYEIRIIEELPEIIGHTHPAGGKVLLQQHLKELAKKAPGGEESDSFYWRFEGGRENFKELSRLKDIVLKASPSGINYDYNPIKYKVENKILKSTGIFGPSQRRRYNRLKGNTRLSENLDMGVIKQLDKSHSILAPGVEGVHKYREKLPRAVRSVYFKGGL